MVRKGDFTVELIHAESRMKFNEHVGPKDGQIYAEVEPKAEYFIRFSSNHDKRVMYHISIDDEELGYFSIQEPNTLPRDNGLWSCDDGKSTEKCFKFGRSNVWVGDDQPHSINNNNILWTGKVEVEIYDASIFEGYDNCEDFNSNWTGKDVGYISGITDPDKKKGVKTIQGDSNMKTEEYCGSTFSMRFKQGELLEKISLNYCSCLGLIYNGILHKPPIWDMHRMEFPSRGKIDHKDAVRVTPEKVQKEEKINDENKHGVVLLKEYEQLDLTKERTITKRSAQNDDSSSIVPSKKIKVMSDDSNILPPKEYDLFDLS